MRRVPAFAIAFAALTAVAGGAWAKGPAEPRGRYVFECEIALMILPQRQFSSPAPVTVSFVADRGVLSDIHVVDKGGILFPGGNLKLVEKPDVLSLEAVAMPAERPGQWRGSVAKKYFKLNLTSGEVANAVTIDLARTPDKRVSRHGLAWTATHKPEGMPGPISGTGAGLCTPGRPQGTAK